MLWFLQVSLFGKSDDLTGLSPTCGASSTITHAAVRRTMLLPASNIMTLMVYSFLNRVLT